MARQYVVTEEEMQSLLDSMTLQNMRLQSEMAPGSPIHRQHIDGVHRQFHGIAVRWAQAMGFDGYRK